MLNKLFYFNSGIARELIASGTNCSPLDMIHGGKSILVNCPSCEYGDTGALISSCWKYLAQKVVLAREFKSGDFYNLVWVDEAWQICTSFDQHYAATSRSHGGAMCFLAQGRDSFYSALRGEDGKNFVHALSSTFHHKILHAPGSADDAEYASSLLGRHRELFVSGGTQPYKDVFDGFLGDAQFTASTSEQYQPILQPRVFLSGLRTGGAPQAARRILHSHMDLLLCDVAAAASARAVARHGGRKTQEGNRCRRSPIFPFPRPISAG